MDSEPCIYSCVERAGGPTLDSNKVRPEAGEPLYFRLGFITFSPSLEKHHEK